MDDYELDEEPCPQCGDYFLRWRDCGCEDGEIDRYDEDPLWYDGQNSYETCEQCGGFGVQRWCSGCGWDQAVEASHG